MRRRRPTWGPDDLRTFLALAEGSRLAAAYWLALRCGLQCTEIVALRTSDYDPRQGVLEVSRSLAAAGRVGQNQTPSLPASRWIQLPSDVAERLARRLRTVAHEAVVARLEGAWQGGNDPPIFGTLTGAMTQPRAFVHSFWATAADAGVPTVRFAELRRLHAALGTTPLVLSR